MSIPLCHCAWMFSHIVWYCLILQRLLITFQHYLHLDWAVAWPIPSFWWSSDPRHRAIRLGGVHHRDHDLVWRSQEYLLLDWSWNECSLFQSWAYKHEDPSQYPMNEQVIQWLHSISVQLSIVDFSLFIFFHSYFLFTTSKSFVNMRSGIFSSLALVALYSSSALAGPIEKSE